MEDEKIVEIAIKEGFTDAAIIDTEDIVFDASFRPYCEENLCGQYGANYSCPPDCGTPEEMKQRVQKHKRALVLRTVWNINDFTDSSLIKSAKQKHNAYTISVIEQMEKEGHMGFMVCASGCSLCNPCAITKGDLAGFQINVILVCLLTVFMSKIWLKNVVWFTITKMAPCRFF